MTKETAKQLLEYIEQTIDRKVEQKMKVFKAQLIKELNSRTTKPMINGSVLAKSLNTSKKRIAADPLLNEILSRTTPIDSTGDYEEDTTRPSLNYVTSDVDGRPVDLSNPAVLKVVEAMNKNYSDVVSTPKPKISANVMKSIASSGFDDEEDYTSGVADPFNEAW